MFSSFCLKLGFEKVFSKISGSTTSRPGYCYTQPNLYLCILFCNFAVNEVFLFNNVCDNPDTRLDAL